MNYYPFHIGDYLRDTAHLTLVEHGAYRRMMDLYYASEKPLPTDQVWLFRLLRAETETEREAVAFVLSHFFYKSEDGWRSKRCDAEIRAADRRTKAARTNGKKGGRPQTQRVSSGLANSKPDETQSKAPNNQKPLTNNQEKRAGRGSRLPAGWEPSEILRAWAVKERPDLDQRVTEERFRNHWIAAPGSRGLKSDWEATFRNWVLGERAGAKGATPDYSSLQDRLQDGA